MTTIHFKFPDEATAKTALAQYVANGQWVTGSHQHALDPIGTLYTAPVLDSNGNVTIPAQPLPGWHVNLIGIVPSIAEQYTITPASPMRVFVQ